MQGRYVHVGKKNNVLLSFFLMSDQRMSDGFDETYDVICQFDWYLFPKEIKRMMPMFIMDHQQPVVFRGYANLPCVREQFKTVHSFILYHYSSIFFRKKLDCHFAGIQRRILVFHGASSIWNLMGINVCVNPILIFLMETFKL